MKKSTSGRTTQPCRGAAGLTALKVTFDHAQRQTGIPRALRVLASANQKTGFDCPGCAWPDPETRSPAEFCENGAKAILDEATTRKVGRSFFAQHSVDALKEKSERWLNEQGRLLEPMILRSGSTHYSPITYEEAFSLIGEKMRHWGPAKTSFYTSGRASNEAAFLLSLMAREFGTNNLPDCSNLCHESSGIALKETLGIGKGTVRLKDFAQSDLIFVIGQNPGTNHPRMLSALKEAKKNGATIVSVNPLIETGLINFSHPQDPEDLLNDGTPLADHFVQLNINGDLALFRGINKSLLKSDGKKESAVDHPFIKKHVRGFDDFLQVCKESSWKKIVSESGIVQEEIERLARLIENSDNMIACWAMGLTQHQNAVATIQEVTNLLLLTGNMGRPGAGACPVRGHSNVQGDRTMGIALTLPVEHARRMKHEWQVPMPKAPGLDAVGTIEAMAQGKVKAFFALGGNFLSASPDTQFTGQALAQCALTVHVSTKLNRSHLTAGSIGIILPCLGRTERDITSSGEQKVSVENSMGVVHSSRGKLRPAHPQLLGEPSIIARLALEICPPSPHTPPWSKWVHDYEAIRDGIAKVVPGFERYNQRLAAPGGFELPNGPRERNFTTEDGYAHFIASEISRIQLKEGELLLMTVRSHDQFNTTVYSNDDRYRGIYGTRKVLLLNKEDLQKRELKSGDLLQVTSHFTNSQGESETRVLQGLRAHCYALPPGSAMAYFPETNPLVFINSHAARSRTPTSKSIRITIKCVQE